MPITIAYEWSQTATHLSLRLSIPPLKADLRHRQSEKLSVVVASCHLRVCCHPWLLELDFWGDVAFRSATVTPGAGCLTIFVPKVEEGLWDSLTAVSSPEQQHDIRERRRSSLAAYAQWQEQLQQQRIAARDARKQQQQKHIWRQQQEQREWHEYQKSMQVQQVLDQLPEESEQSALCRDTQEATSSPLADDQTWENKLHGFCEAEITTDSCSSQEGVQHFQEHVDAGLVADSSAASSPNGTVGGKQSAAVGFNDKAYAKKRNEEAQAKTPVPTPATRPEACTEQTSNLAPLNKELVRAFSYGQLAVPEVHPINPSPCTKIKVSFAARRPNKAPARGPLAPPLPQTEQDLGRDIYNRDKPEDLSRLQESSPLWLHSKATRLLIGGDTAAADETYSLILQPSQSHTIYRLVYIKALCGRSLARLASGVAQKALSDCSEAMTLLQELHQQKDAAAAVAGQLLEKGPQESELLHLQHILLARRAAAFLRLDSLEDAAKSLEELLELQPSQTLARLNQTDFGGNGCLDQQRAAVSVDLLHIRRLQQMRKVKEEADTLLRLASAAQQGRLGVQAPSAKPRPGHAFEAKQPPTVCGATEQAPQTQCLLQRSIEFYENCLNLLQHQPPEGCERLGSTTTPKGKESFTSDAMQTEQAAGVTAVADRIRAVVQALATINTNSPWAVAAAAALSNMTRALLHLQGYSVASVASSALATVETLIQHAEERLRLQQIERLASLSPTEATEEGAGGRVNASRCTTESPHCLSSPFSAGHLGVLHRANEHLLRKLREEVYSSREQARRQRKSEPLKREKRPQTLHPKRTEHERMPAAIAVPIEPSMCTRKQAPQSRLA